MFLDCPAKVKRNSRRQFDRQGLRQRGRSDWQTPHQRLVAIELRSLLVADFVAGDVLLLRHGGTATDAVVETGGRIETWRHLERLGRRAIHVASHAPTHDALANAKVAADLQTRILADDLSAADDEVISVLDLRDEVNVMRLAFSLCSGGSGSENWRLFIDEAGWPHDYHSGAIDASRGSDTVGRYTPNYESPTLNWFQFSAKFHPFTGGVHEARLHYLSVARSTKCGWQHRK